VTALAAAGIRATIGSHNGGKKNPPMVCNGQSGNHGGGSSRLQPEDGHAAGIVPFMWHVTPRVRQPAPVGPSLAAPRSNSSTVSARMGHGTSSSIGKNSDAASTAYEATFSLFLRPTVHAWW
jgi:hypothetical protein